MLPDSEGGQTLAPIVQGGDSMLYHWTHFGEGLQTLEIEILDKTRSWETLFLSLFRLLEQKYWVV